MGKVVTITGAYPEFYQVESRPVEDFTVNDLAGVSEDFGGFSTEVGDKWQFEDLAFYNIKGNARKQRVQTNEQIENDRRAGRNVRPTYVYMVKAVRIRGGVASNEWFSLNFLNKRDADRIAVNPGWISQGDAKKRLAKLCEMGEIEILSTHKIRVPAAFQGGRPVRVPTLDPNTGEQKIDEYGTAMTHVETREQDAYVVTPPTEGITEAPVAE